MQRVLFVSLYPLNGVGGGERYSLNTIRSIEMSGDFCTAYAVAKPLPPRQPLAGRLNTTLMKVTPGPPAAFGETLALRNLIEELSTYDTVVIHQYLSNDLVFDLIANLASDQTCILTNLGHEPVQQEFRTCFQPSPRFWFVEISDYSARRAAAFSRQSLSVNAGIWRCEIQPPWVQRNGFEGRLCAVGRVLPHKGIEVTIDALPPDCALTVVGPNREDPSYLRWLRSQARKRAVHFTGAIPEENKQAIVADADLLVASSHHRLYDGRLIPQPELLGLVIFEALALNTMPLVSSIPSFSEVMSQLGLSHYVYQEDSVSCLRETIERHRETPAGEIAESIQSARERIAGRFLWDDFWVRIKQQVGL